MAKATATKRKSRRRIGEEGVMTAILRRRLAMGEPEGADGCYGRSLEGMARCLRCGLLHDGETGCPCRRRR